MISQYSSRISHSLHVYSTNIEKAGSITFPPSTYEYPPYNSNPHSEGSVRFRRLPNDVLNPSECVYKFVYMFTMVTIFGKHVVTIFGYHTKTLINKGLHSIFEVLIKY